METKSNTAQKVGKGCLFAFLGFIVIGVLGAIFGDDKTEDAKSIAKTEETIIPIDETRKQAGREKAKREVDSLLKNNFIEERDDFKKISFYYHKKQGKQWFNRKGIRVIVNTTGFAYLESNYYGEDWIFHTQTICLCGEKQSRSENIDRLGDNYLSNNNGGYVWEVNQYLNSLSLLQFIAYCEEPIKVRFQGSKNVSDFTLSETDKVAIKDALALKYAIEATQ